MEKLTDFLFIAQVMILAAIVIRWSARRRVPGVAGLGLIGWLALTGSLAIQGFFADWSRLPPRLLPAVLVPMIGGLLLLTYSRQTRALLAATPLEWPIYLQSFRILMEIILWLLYVQHRAPAIMTFEGRNVDILVGLTAIPVGPALDAVALPRLPHRSARHLHRRLALYLAARLPCPPRLAPPRGVHHPTPPLLENSRRGRTRQAW